MLVCYVLIFDWHFKDVGVHWFIVVVLVPIIEEAEKSVFKDLIDGGLASASGAHTHESITHQLSLIQLNHLKNLTTHTHTESQCITVTES